MIWPIPGYNMARANASMIQLYVHIMLVWHIQKLSIFFDKCSYNSYDIFITMSAIKPSFCIYVIMCSPCLNYNIHRQR